MPLARQRQTEFQRIDQRTNLSGKKAQYRSLDREIQSIDGSWGLVFDR
jgi:hypothetical protein